MTQLSDELLLAYLDGQLERAQAISIAELAADNPEVTRRLLRLKKTQAHLIETFTAIRREEREVPMELQVPEPRLHTEVHSTPQAAPSPQYAPSPAAAAPHRHVPPRKDSPSERGRIGGLVFIGVLLAGLGGGYLAHAIFAPKIVVAPKIEDRAGAGAAASPEWISELAQFHAFFPGETLTPHPDAITNPDLIKFQLAKITGRPIAPPDFARQNYNLVRGQTFNFGATRMMQLTFASKSEPPLAVYVVPGGEERPITKAARDGFNAVGWSSPHLRFLIAAQKSTDDLSVLATVAQSQLSKRP